MSNSIPKYSTYTYDHPNFLVRYPHVKRNTLVAEKIADLQPTSWLDFGAGDGAILEKLQELQSLPSTIVCYEPEDGMRTELVTNVASLNKNESSMVQIVGSIDQAINRKYDLITSLEVLEHLPLPERVKFYKLLAQTLNPSGTCLIEVPIEYGPILLLKEFGRRVLKGRISDYSIWELVKATLCLNIEDTGRRYDPMDSRSFISQHRGFDLRRLLKELNSLGECSQIMKSPFPFLPKIFNQVVLFSFRIHERNINRIEAIAADFAV